MRVRSFGEEPEARSGHSAVVIGKERMMVFGGCDVKRGVCFSDTFVLDLRRLKWERMLSQGPWGEWLGRLCGSQCCCDESS